MQINTAPHAVPTTQITNPTSKCSIAPSSNFINNNEAMLRAFGGKLTAHDPFTVSAKFSSPQDAVTANAMFRNEVNGAAVHYVSFSPQPTAPATIEGVLSALKGAKNVGIDSAIIINKEIDPSKPGDPNSTKGILGVLADAATVPMLQNLLRDNILGYEVVVELNNPVKIS